ncbi:MAG TPA: adenine deaminase [Bacteroidales bacterium]|nr:adenine deaminase [Bacteroidales bacterium]
MEKQDLEFRGNIVDVVGERIFKGIVIVRDSKIEVVREEENSENVYILPGLIDAHIHIESSMLIPSEFARLAVVHGTVGTVSDPHEIANVLGVKGVRFMIENGKKVPFKFYFGASSCVPATGFETAGGSLGLAELDELLQSDDILYLSEMMNFPGVVYGDEQVAQKLALAKKYGKPVDGHAPGLTGELAEKYVRAGISTDHECYTLEEAVEKIRYGMKILIREGSAAKNFEALSDLITEYPEMVMLCSDDKHPNDLVSGHINQLVKRAFSLGYDKMKVLRCATYNPVKHYRLDAGLLQQGDPADFILVDDLENFTILATYVNGRKVAENGKTLIPSVPVIPVNQFHAKPVKTEDIVVRPGGKRIRVMKAIDGQLVTEELIFDARIENNEVKTDLEHDVLKIVVMNRYFPAPPAVGFVKGFGLRSGAIASCVAHDSHNIIAVGTDDESIVAAINAIVSSQGGISVASGDEVLVLPLPVAGIMSDEDGYKVAGLYKNLNEQVKKKLKTTLKAPFMTLSFMALLVIPDLKLSDKGLFNGKKFSFTGLFEK